jgi:hypothetical protein
MANAITVGTIEQGNKQFQGAFKEMWTVNATAAFDTNVAADAGEEFALTVPGLALGDMVIGIAPGGADPEPNVFDYEAQVTAANTLSISVHATGADTPLPTSFKVLVGRPNW